MKTLLKQLILQGEMIEVTTDSDDMINIWHHKQWGCDMFVLELNGKVIKSEKNFSEISKKFNELITIKNKISWKI